MGTRRLRRGAKDGTVGVGTPLGLGMTSDSSNANDKVSIGRIPLKQVRVSRSEREKEAAPNPMNRLVPYLDLFARLDDDELARLAGVERDVAATLREQVVAINEGLAAYVDLLPRLSDTELVRLTGASDRTIRFWRLCQPRGGLVAKAAAEPAAQTAAGVPSESKRVPTAPHAVVPPASESSPHLPTVTKDDAAGYVTLSGAPFPGFDHEDGAGGEGVTLEEVEGEPDPLGLGG